MASKGTLVSALQTRRKEILANWLEQLERCVGFAKGRLSTKEIGKQADEFLNIAGSDGADARHGRHRRGRLAAGASFPGRPVAAAGARGLFLRRDSDVHFLAQASDLRCIEAGSRQRCRQDSRKRRGRPPSCWTSWACIRSRPSRYRARRSSDVSRSELLELSTPVVKLWDGILALPMIGTLDSARTQIVMESLLQKIVETESQIAIIDITGVPDRRHAGGAAPLEDRHRDTIDGRRLHHQRRTSANRANHRSSGGGSAGRHDQGESCRCAGAGAEAQRRHRSPSSSAWTAYPYCGWASSCSSPSKSTCRINWRCACRMISPMRSTRRAPRAFSSTSRRSKWSIRSSAA